MYFMLLCILCYYVFYAIKHNILRISACLQNRLKQLIFFLSANFLHQIVLLLLRTSSLSKRIPISNKIASNDPFNEIVNLTLELNRNVILFTLYRIIYNH